MIPGFASRFDVCDCCEVPTKDAWHKEWCVNYKEEE